MKTGISRTSRNKENGSEVKRKGVSGVGTIVGFILALLALSDTMVPEADIGDSVDGWGIAMLVTALGLGGIFFLMKERNKQKHPMLGAISILFAVFTLFGKSYMETGGWSYIFYDKIQFCRAIFVGGGYALIYKNCILFVGWLAEQLPESVWRRQACGKVERWLFESHPFLGPALIIWILEIPWFVCFFPGTVEPDAKHQLLMSYGMVEMTTHHPVLVTKLMGKCMYFGRILFGADNMGVFLYTFLQFGMQSLVIAYTIYVLNHIKVPMMVRWGALAFYSLYPIFPIWGYTMVKDSGYYIFILLFVTVLLHILYEESEHPKWWMIVLLMISTVGIGTFRKDGCCVVILTLVWGLFGIKKYRKIFFMGIVSCLITVLLINVVYVKMNHISSGSIREALSVPVQQTARYVKQHYNEITAEELKVLQNVFVVDMEELAELYTPEFSDPVKGVFVLEPDRNDLKAYMEVWWKQFLKHPDTYVQAFLNHTYGYFYPDKRESWEGEDIGVFRIAENERFDLKFGIENDRGREILEGYARLVKCLPVVGMLYSTGIHTWILLGCVLSLISKRKWSELMIYIPGICILAVCVLSPVNACVRYMLPIMVLLPIHLGWLKCGRKISNI